MSPPGPVGAMTWLPRDATLASVTRIAELAETGVAPLLRAEWATGDFVLAEVLEDVGRGYDMETRTGRMAAVIPGDLLVGALGERSATLEAVGSWRDVGDDLVLHALTRAGVLGRVTSASPLVHDALAPLRYRGHVVREGRPARMRDAVPVPSPRPFVTPVVVVIGTSMSAGKTTSVVTIVRRLRRLGLHVGAGKLTGVARYREILGMADAGADPVVDFVDAGLPSTICPSEEYAAALEVMLGRLAEGERDVVVLEAGASPLEPYNVGHAFAALAPHVRCTVLCASDPYAVVGVASAYGVRPDLVAGRATSTSAGIALCQRLAEVECLNLLDPETYPDLDRLLVRKLGL